MMSGQRAIDKATLTLKNRQREVVQNIRRCKMGLLPRRAADFSRWAGGQLTQEQDKRKVNKWNGSHQKCERNDHIVSLTTNEQSEDYRVTLFLYCMGSGAVNQAQSYSDNGGIREILN